MCSKWEVVAHSGLISLATFWSDKISPDFLSQSNPYAAAPPVSVTASYASGGTQITFSGPSLPAGYQYNWLSAGNCNQILSTAQQFTAGTGMYKLKLIDANRNTIFSPTLNVSGTALPVTWQSFNARLASTGRVELKWSTSEEINASHFEVQRSTDAFTFSTVAQVDAGGDSKTARFYHFDDEFLKRGTYYYRLKEVDKDGSYEFTRIASVRIAGNETVRAYPNPVIDVLTLESANELGHIDVFNSLGNRLRTVNTREKTFHLNTSDLPKGIYVISVDGKPLHILK